MRFSDDERRAILRRAYATRDLHEADRQRQRQQRQLRGPDPVDDLPHIEPLPPADWRGCLTTKEMTKPQFDAWCDAGHPKLGEIIPPAPRANKDIERLRARVVSAEKSLTDIWSAADNLAGDVGAVTGGIERKVNELADDVGKLRAELVEVRAERSGDAVLDLPDDWRTGVAH